MVLWLISRCVPSLKYWFALSSSQSSIVFLLSKFQFPGEALLPSRWNIWLLSLAPHHLCVYCASRHYYPNLGSLAKPCFTLPPTSHQGLPNSNLSPRRIFVYPVVDSASLIADAGFYCQRMFMNNASITLPSITLSDVSSFTYLYFTYPLHHWHALHTPTDAPQ